MTLRILSLNAGLLKLFGREIPVPFVRERLAALPHRLLSLQADLIFLQEVYGQAARDWVVDSVRNEYPYAFHPRGRRRFGLENGLITLSRSPLDGELELFSDAAPDERWFDSKGMLITCHRLSDGRDLNAINLHTTAGGMFQHPEDPRTDSTRARQLCQVLKRAAKLPSPLLLAGDFNAGPGVSEGNFQTVLDAGFVSVHDELHPQCKDATWHPGNPLNANGPHKACPPQRIDHVLLRQNDASAYAVRPIGSQICLNEPDVDLPGGAAVTVSDHFGLLVEIEIVPNLQHLTTANRSIGQYQAP